MTEQLHPVDETEILRRSFEMLREQLSVALGALADIGFSADMTMDVAKRKARRVHHEVSEKLWFLDPDKR